MVNVKVRLLMVFSIVMVMTGCSSFGEKTDSNEINHHVAKVTLCFKNMDIECVASTLSDDVKITNVSNIGGNVKKYQLSKDEYLHSLEDYWSASQEYVYLPVSHSVISSEIGSPAYTERVVETITIDGVEYKNTIDATVYLMESDEGLLATKIDAASFIFIN